jgi:hypothetical protein
MTEIVVRRVSESVGDAANREDNYSRNFIIFLYN